MKQYMNLCIILSSTFLNLWKVLECQSGYKDCEQYFTMFKVGNDKKVAVAGLQLQGIARRWFQTQIVERPKMQWPEFCKLLVARFGAWEQEMLYDSFKQLQQTTTVELYFTQFERYKEQLREKMPELTEVFFVEYFVGGLQGGIKETLQLLAPSTVEQAYRQAKHYVKSTRYDQGKSQGSKPMGKIEEVNCVALGMKDFFEPKQNFEEGNLSGTKLLECTSDFRIKSREMKFDDKEDTDVPTKSGPESQMPQDLIASTKLANLRLQPTPCFILKVQDVNSLKDYDKELGSSQQHPSKGIQVHYKITSADANKGQMQLLIGSGQASETLKAKSDVVLGAQNHHLSQSGTVGKFPRDKLEFFCVNHLIKCSPCSPTSKFLLDMNSERNTVLVKDGHGLNDSIDVIKEAGARKTEIYTNESSMEVVEFACKNLNNEMIPIQLEEVSSIIPTRRDTVEAFHSNRSIKDFPSAEISYDMGIRSSNFGKDNMLIFDPGGQVQLEEAVMKNSVGSKLMHWQNIDILAMEQQLLKEPSQLQRKVFIIEIEISARLQGQGQNIQKESDGFDNIVCEINQQFVNYERNGMIALPYQYQYMVLGQGRYEIYKSTGPAYHKAESAAIYIFDPGGDSTCLHGVLIVISVGILKVHHMLQDIVLESLSNMQGKTAEQVEGSEEVQVPP